MFFFAWPGDVLSQVSKPRAESGRTVYSLNDKWQFAKDSADHPYNAINTLTHWQNVTIPHTWNATDVMSDEHPYYRGAAWYKRNLVISNDSQKQVFLYFDGVNQEAEIYINGKKAGEHKGGYTRFCIPVSSFIKTGTNAVNEIAVKVNNRFNEDIPPLTADFTFFGGIYRNLYLVTTNSVHFNTNDFGGSSIRITTPSVTTARASVVIKAQVYNEGAARTIKLVSTIFDSDGKIIATLSKNQKTAKGKADTVSQSGIVVNNPKLWSPDHPYLYNVVTQIIDNKNGEIIDELSTPLGFRWYSFDADKGFFLNGKPLKLIGASRHQDYKDLGNAVRQELQSHDIELLKAMGGNFLRVSHYPQDPVVLQMCDKLGIIASVEIPVVNAITETAGFTDNCSNMLREMIAQNFNHPSLVIWAYMNEIMLRPKFAKDKPRQQQYFENIVKLAKHLDSICRAQDPARYTMIANHGDYNLYTRTGLTAVPQIIGWNLYQGWYSGDVSGFGKFLDEHHGQPAKPVIVTEYGADADPRIHALNPVRFDKSIEYAEHYHDVYLKAILERPFVAGAAAWNLVDFNSESREETMPHINNKGLMTDDRQPKATYYLYQAALKKEAFIKIASESNIVGVEDSTGTTCTRQVRVYTNLKGVKLSLNGQDLAGGKAEDFSYTFTVPFRPGMNYLEATADNQTVKDFETVEVFIQPNELKAFKADAQPLSILLGAKRYYYDMLNKQTWQPDQPYRKGSWGSMGGHAFKMVNGRQSYGSDKAIAGTDNDPVFQTQQVGIEGYRFDVPDGQYELTLNFAELSGGKVSDPLPYNLGTSEVTVPGYQERIFDVFINNQCVLKELNIAREVGFAWAMSKKIPVTVTRAQGIQINFKALKGEAVLNAIQLKRIY
nr:glycoside hydrolase family 2 TIM barrel-domain containing protein [Mucilaginibacter straminoryzae]